MDHSSLRKAHDHILVAILLDARIGRASDGRPANFGNDTLCVSKLESTIAHLVTIAHGFFEVSGEEGAPLRPVVVDRASFLADGGPEIIKLFFSCESLIGGSIEVVDCELDNFLFGLRIRSGSNLLFFFLLISVSSSATTSLH